MGKVWFTSDQHFGHRLVTSLRGFGQDTAAHDESIVATIKSQVADEDQIWFLGDLAIGHSPRALEAVLSLVDGLSGIKHLILGNHDAASPIHRDSHHYQRRYLEVFQSVQPFARRKIADQHVLLSHFPYTGDSGGGDRFGQYRLRNHASWLLHGHTHSSEKITSSREIHVGWDAWGRLVHIDEIASIIHNQMRNENA